MDTEMWAAWCDVGEAKKKKGIVSFTLKADKLRALYDILSLYQKCGDYKSGNKSVIKLIFSTIKKNNPTKETASTFGL